MEINARNTGDINVVTLNGRFDAHSAPGVEEKVQALISESKPFFVLNMEGVGFISSCGIRALVSMTKKLREMNGDLVLTCVHPSVEDVIAIVDLKDFFTVAPTEEAGIDICKGGV